MQARTYEKPKKMLDPRFVHIEGFRRTSSDIRRRQHMATTAVREMVDGTHSPQSMHDSAEVAKRYASEVPNGDDRKIYAGILGAMPGYITAIHQLPDDEDNPYAPELTYEQREAAIKKTIAYDDIIRDTLNHNPHIRPDEILTIVSLAAKQYRLSDEDYAIIEKKTRNIMVGMQHELAFESALYYLPDGFEVIESDGQERDAEDAKGADYRVRCPNGVIVNIDVKASKHHEAKAREKRWKRLKRRGKTPPRNEIILYSGFTQDDFDAKNPWRPTQDAIDRVLPYIEDALLQASGDNRTAEAFAMA